MGVDVEVGQQMATGRIRRSARRGLAAAALGWLGVAAFSVLLAPGASAAPTATVEIKNVTPPVASVDKGGTVTFVNRIPAQNKGGISIPLVGSVTATVHTDVAVSFFGQTRGLQTGQSTAWTFTDAATPGTIAYTYRIVPQAGLAATAADQVVSTVAKTLPPLPAPVPYVVQTIAPDVPALPSVNLPQLPTVNVPLPVPGGPTPPTVEPPDDTPTEEPPVTDPPPAPSPAPGPAYAYDTAVGAPQMSPSDIAAVSAFDPARFYAPGSSTGGVDRSGAGGAPGGYDGASVPVFGQLAGLDGTALDEESSGQPTAGAEATPAQTLPAAALAAVVALAAVTAALVRTHQASRSSR
jgi:hypothetical protein